jgi:DNA-binding CsgD family transcriptional regulator
MTVPVQASESDLRALAAIVSEDRPDWPPDAGLPPCGLSAGELGQLLALPAMQLSDRTGDMRSAVKISDFYSARQWRSVGAGCGINQPLGFDSNLMLTLAPIPGPDDRPGRTMRLCFFRGPGLDFSEQDRAVLTLLRPHLQEAWHAAERRRHPVPRLTPRQWELLRLLANGSTNTQLARCLGISEGTVRSHLEAIYARLGVSSRTAAVARAFPDRGPAGI